MAVTQPFPRLLWLLLLLTTSFPQAVLSDPPVFSNDDAKLYNRGKFGVVPETAFKTTDVQAKHLLRRKWDDRCKSDDFFFLTPRGKFAGWPGPTIIDNNGHLVWLARGFQPAYNFLVQTYKGAEYLTWWTGDDRVIGHGAGNYYMFDQHYEQFKKVSAIGDRQGDLHEFLITEDDTALVTVYYQVPWNLTSVGGPEDGWIWDCLFQEIDLEKEELLFEWNALGHFTFDDCFNPVLFHGTMYDAWDWFHLNSVQKDKWGNYLISARYTHSLSYIDGRTKEILWQFGGKNNSFTDLSNGTATNIKWQHDARWHDDYSTITLFDNQGYFRDKLRPSRGLHVRIDQERMTAEVITEILHPREYRSESQGSVQLLSNGNYFIGYGNVAAFSEFAPDGKELLCDIQYAAMKFLKGAKFVPSAAQSYRVFKKKWVGVPYWNPDVLFENGQVFVSWNGATEYCYWTLKGTNTLGKRRSQWEDIARIDKDGYEANVTVDYTGYRMFRLEAFDKHEASLGAWLVFSGGKVEKIPEPEERPMFQALLFMAGAIGAFIITYCRIGICCFNFEYSPAYGLRLRITRWRPHRSSAPHEDADNTLDSDTLLRHSTHELEAMPAPD